MNNISIYITEKLKLNKDTKSNIKDLPKRGDNVIVLWTDDPKNNDMAILFGKVTEVKPISHTISISYTLNGYSTHDLFYCNDDTGNYIGRTTRSGIFCYDLNFAKAEIEKALKTEKWEFDGYNIPGGPRRLSEKELFEITLKIINEKIEENEESDE